MPNVSEAWVHRIKTVSEDVFIGTFSWKYRGWCGQLREGNAPRTMEAMVQVDKF